MTHSDKIIIHHHLSKSCLVITTMVIWLTNSYHPPPWNYLIIPRSSTTTAIWFPVLDKAKRGRGQAPESHDPEIGPGGSEGHNPNVGGFLEVNKNGQRLRLRNLMTMADKSDKSDNLHSIFEPFETWSFSLV